MVVQLLMSRHMSAYGAAGKRDLCARTSVTPFVANMLYRMSVSLPNRDTESHRNESDTAISMVTLQRHMELPCYAITV